jgi:hypothetical protein
MTAKNLNGHGWCSRLRINDPLLGQQQVRHPEGQLQIRSSICSQSGRAQKRARNCPRPRALREFRSHLELRLIEGAHHDSEVAADRLICAAFTAPPRQGL